MIQKEESLTTQVHVFGRLIMEFTCKMRELVQSPLTIQPHLLQDLGNQLDNILEQISERCQNLITAEQRILLNISKYNEQMTRAKNWYHLPNEIVKLNVGGEAFVTTQSTLTRIPDSLFSAHFSGKVPITFDSEGCCFIDRDPNLFRHILTGLRTDHWYVPEDIEEKLTLANELRYFRLLAPSTVYLLGGHDGRNRINTVLNFDLSTEQWSASLPPMHFVRSQLSAVAYQNKIYAFGGRDQNSQLSSGEFIDLDQVSLGWRLITSMSTARSYPSAVVFQGSIYVLGGQDHRDIVLNSSEHYDPENDIWSTNICPMYFARFAAAAVVIRDGIYVIGGLGAQLNRLPHVEVYSPEHNSWKRLAPISQARHCLSAVLFSNRIFTMGGFGQQDSVATSVDCYDPHSNTWTRMAPLSSPRAGASAFSYNDRIYIFGGWSGSVAVNTIEVYDEYEGKWKEYSVNLPTPLHGAASAFI